MGGGGDRVVKGILADLAKELGDRCDVHVLGDGLFAAEPKEWLSSGLTLLDAAINPARPVRGCIPVGRVTEIFGDVATAKSMLVGTMMGQAQREFDAVCALVDTEHAWSVNFVKEICRADPNGIYYLDPTNLEDCWDAVDIFIDKVRERDQKRPILIGIDSLAGLPAKEEDAASFDEHSSIANAARVNKKAMRKLRKKVSAERVAIVMTNQEIAKINAMPFSEKTTTSGGFGPKYFSSLRLRTDQLQKKREDGELVGIRYRITVYKTRFSAPGRNIDFFVNFKTGIDDIESVIAFLSEKHQLGNKKGWTTFGGTQLRARDLRTKAMTDAAVWTELQALAVHTLDRTVEEEPETAETVEGVA